MGHWTKYQSLALGLDIVEPRSSFYWSPFWSSSWFPSWDPSWSLKLITPFITPWSPTLITPLITLFWLPLLITLLITPQIISTFFACTVGLVCTAVKFSFKCISQARDVKMIHFKSPKSSTAGKPWGRVQLHQGGQECINKDNYFGKISCGQDIFSVDPTIFKMQTC